MKKTSFVFMGAGYGLFSILIGVVSCQAFFILIKERPVPMWSFQLVFYMSAAAIMFLSIGLALTWASARKEYKKALEQPLQWLE